ncbi:MAG: tyrosine-type recombinase/integrase [Lentisphaeria bacterium]|nr:tyrosine-type recombinase/integrase [Lentisphaeria bacterium]
MAIIKRKGSANWYLVTLYVDPKDGKSKQRWQTTGKTDRKEAEAWAAAQQLEPAGAGEPMTFDAAWRFYFDNHCAPDVSSPVSSPETRAQYRKRRSWEHFITWMGGRYRAVRFLHEVNYRHAMEYAKELRRHVSSHTYNLELAKLREIFDKLEQPAGLTVNPFRAVPTAKKVRHVPYKCLTDDELRRLLAASPPEWRLAITIALYTGLDFADVRHLRWADVVATPYGLVIHKTRRKVQFTGTAPMVIALHPRLEALLSTLPRDGECVLPRKFQTRGCEGEFPGLLQTAGITPDGFTLGFHCLRVTFCTRLEASGVAAEHRAKLMGHSTPDMTAIYSRDVEQARAAVAKLDFHALDQPG